MLGVHRDCTTNDPGTAGGEADLVDPPAEQLGIQSIRQVSTAACRLGSGCQRPFRHVLSRAVLGGARDTKPRFAQSGLPPARVEEHRLRAWIAATRALEVTPPRRAPVLV